MKTLAITVGPRQVMRATALLLACVALVSRFDLAGAKAAATARTVGATAGIVAASSAPVVSTRDGRLRGVVRGAVRMFLGVPYAAPPIGQLRFRAPRPPARWTGVRSAVRFGRACVQFEPIHGVGTQSENCLYLNIWEPKNARSGSRLPVLLWYHGGGLAFGSGAQYRGEALARMTHSVVVTINYRLGALGYLALPQLGAESPRLGPGNYGLLDQIQALKWIRTNIGSFGGDARRVTIAGESAGGLSVCAVLASPLARGLFARAIIESFPCQSTELAGSRAGVEQTSDRFAAAAGCADSQVVAACLRRATPAALVRAAVTVPVAEVTEGTGVLPRAPGLAIGSGRWNRVPVLLGTNQHEGKLFSIPPFAPPGITTQLTAAQFKIVIPIAFGAKAPQIEAAYPVSAYQTPWYAFAELFGDGEFSCPTASTADVLSRAVPTWRYEFDDPHSPGSKGLTPHGIDMANSHTAELDYIWDYTAASHPLSAIQRKLSRQMIRYWGAFVRTGDPSVPGQAVWPAYRAATHKVLSLRPTGSHVIGSFAQEHHCAVWSP
ncbi:MAG: carboxylesterase family protein [Solirubrobacteraceae bacterium]